MQLVARKNTLKKHRTSFRIEVESFVHQDARYARNHEYPKALNHIPCVVLSCIKMHATWNYAWDVSVVQQNARYDMGKTRRCANVKQCKLKVWGVAVVDL